ncbi:MAG: M48 family metalloprotease [Candidatus Latescibacteria bacterium]|nr:M48 family metalloprotease [Candidatus Latescibacterota bacterium]
MPSHHRPSAARVRAMRRAIGIALVVALTLPGCGKALRNFNLISDQEESQLGQQFSREIEQEIKLWRNPEVVDYIDDLGQRLVQHSQRSDIPYHIKVVDTDEVNAFAIPGGYLYVNRGLISAAENESELAGVMGHEIGHVVGRHGSKQLSKQYGLQIITSLILGENPGFVRQLAGGFAGFGGQVGLLRYSREAETEADLYSVHELYDAGIDPQGMATFFEKLLALHDTEPGGLEKLFSTHPPTRERIAIVRAEIAKLPPKAYAAKDSDRFHAIQRKLPAMKKK